MRHSLYCLIQTVLDIQSRGKQEIMGDYRTRVLHSKHAAKFVTSAILAADIVKQGQRHKSDLKDAFN